MSINEECYVAFLDILGFKELIFKKEKSEVKEIFDKIAATRDKIREESSGLLEEMDEIVDNTYMRIMSDSIVIAIPKRLKTSLAFVCECCRIIQSNMLVENILLRGGISKGEFYGDEEIMYGKGLINAYSLEGVAESPRIIISPDIVNEYYSETGTGTPIYITDMIVLDSDNYYFIDYFLQYLSLNNKEDTIKFIKNKICDSSLTGNIRKKYLWLQKYFNSCVSNEKYKSILNECDIIDIDITIGT